MSTPLGIPVDPEVYMRYALPPRTSNGVSSDSPHSATSITWGTSREPASGEPDSSRIRASGSASVRIALTRPFGMSSGSVRETPPMIQIPN